MFIHQINKYNHFRLIQKAFVTLKTKFHTFTLSPERPLKLVIKEIFYEVIDEELINVLTLLNFAVKQVWRFGIIGKPLSIYQNFKKIWNWSQKNL